MEINYFFAEPHARIPVDSGMAGRPFLLSPTEPHPFLTLGDYFQGIADFVLQEEGRPLFSVLEKKLGFDHLTSRDIRHIDISSEKHGALYHIARVTVAVRDEPVSFAATCAVTGEGGTCLRNEFEILRTLAGDAENPCLPEVYFLAENILKSGRNESGIVMMLGEWLEGYHEWHLSLDRKNSQKIRVWDTNAGHYFLTPDQERGILEQAAAILTHFFDPATGSQVHPWHHAAGDFIVSIREGEIDVKLITVRSYQPLPPFPEQDRQKNILPLVAFFLHLVLRMRLDRLDGTGEPAWFAPYALEPSLAGFFKAYGRKSEQPLPTAELLAVLQSFSAEELLSLHTPLLELYQHQDPEDFALILQNIVNHTRELWQCLQEYRY